MICDFSQCVKNDNYHRVSLCKSEYIPIYYIIPVTYYCRFGLRFIDSELNVFKGNLVM